MGVIGPVAGAVALVVGNEILVMGETPWLTNGAAITPNPKIARPVVGGVIAGIFLTVTSNFLPRSSELFAWLILVGTAFVRINPETPSPLESVLSWYNSTPPANGTIPQSHR